MGFERATTGTIIFDGADIDRWPTWRRARQGLSIKMQIPGIYPELTVHDNMRVAAQYHVARGQMEESIERLLARVGLAGMSADLAKNLSHGQQQWLEIGMALSVNPKLLLLDEPTAGMGPGETEATARLVESLNADGVTIMVIEHDMTFVRQIARNDHGDESGQDFRGRHDRRDRGQPGRDGHLSWPHLVPASILVPRTTGHGSVFDARRRADHRRLWTDDDRARRQSRHRSRVRSSPSSGATASARRR